MTHPSLLPAATLFTATLLAVAAAAAGCAPHAACPPPITSTTSTRKAVAPPSESAHVYRLDFVLTGGDAPGSTSFSLNLREHEKGEVMVGKNVSLGGPPTAPAPVGAPMFLASPRQDVGIKVVANYRMLGDDVLLEVGTELSAFDAPSTIRKFTARGNALASAGKPALVATLEDDHKRYQLMVTPQKLR